MPTYSKLSQLFKKTITAPTNAPNSWDDRKKGTFAQGNLSKTAIVRVTAGFICPPLTYMQAKIPKYIPKAHPIVIDIYSSGF